MGAPTGNKNAAGPHEGGAKSAQRAQVLRDDQGLQSLKDKAAQLTKLPSFQKRFEREQAKYAARQPKPKDMP